MAGNISGPGILYVESKISQPDILNEETFMKWYDEEHIPEILETSGINAARRFKDVDPNAQKPYLAMYPMKDIAFLQTEEFKKISVKSDILPGSGLCYDLADLDVRYDNLIQVYDPTKKGPGHTKSLISAQIEMKEDYDADDFDKWYREEHLGLIAKAEGYLRTTRFKLAYARTNAQSRALKGLSTNDEPLPEPPTWLALHEFEVENADLEKIREFTASPWSKKINQNKKQGPIRVYKTVKMFGDGDWFHGVEL